MPTEQREDSSDLTSSEEDESSGDDDSAIDDDESQMRQSERDSEFKESPQKDGSDDEKEAKQKAVWQNLGNFLFLGCGGPDDKKNTPGGEEENKVEERPSLR